MRIRFALPIAWMMAAALSSCSSPDQRLPSEVRSVAVPTARLVSPEARQEGRRLFLAHCALCHGENANGRGVQVHPPARATDFTDRSWRSRVTPRLVYYRLREGVYGTPMPAWRTLPEQELWDLVAYVLSVSGDAP